MKSFFSITPSALALAFGAAPVSAEATTWLLIQTVPFRGLALEKVPMQDMVQCEAVKKVIDDSALMKKGLVDLSKGLCVLGKR